MSKHRPIRWGVLGATSIGTKYGIPAILEADNAQLQALASRNLSKAKKVCQHFGINNAVEGYQKLLDREDIDAVYIPLVTSLHSEWTKKAIAAGKHVLCEKPMTMNAKDIDDIELQAKQAGLVVAEAFMIAHHPQWQVVRKLIADGAIGTLRFFDGCFTYHNTDADNMRNQLELGGGGLRDIGVYPTIGSLLAIQTMPEFVDARIERDSKFKTDSFASVSLGYAHWQGHFYVSTQMALRQWMHFHGDKGRISVTSPFNPGDFIDPEVQLWLHDGTEQTITRFPRTNHYRLQIEAFARSVHNGENYPVTFQLSRQVQRIIDACFQSEAESRPIKLENA